MHFIYKYLFKSFNRIIYLGIFSDNRLLSNIVISKIIKKDFINIFIIIIYTNTINFIFKKIEIIFKI